MCYMNARKERGSDFENFGTRITRFGVVVETIWNFEVSGLFLCIFLRLGTLLGLFSKIRGLTTKFGPHVDFLRVQGPFCKISEITRNNKLFYNG
jgi:hypothetical protein